MDNFLSNAQALQAAEDSLKALPQFSGKELNVFQNVQFYGSSRPRIEIDIQDPENRIISTTTPMKTASGANRNRYKFPAAAT